MLVNLEQNVAVSGCIFSDVRSKLQVLGSKLELPWVMESILSLQSSSLAGHLGSKLGVFRFIEISISILKLRLEGLSREMGVGVGLAWGSVLG